MSKQETSVIVSTDLGIAEELENKEFRAQFFRTELEVDIPAQLKSLRRLRGLKQEELAAVTGMKQSAISRLERSEEANWKMETLLKLAEALDARLTVLFEPYEAVVAQYRRERAISGTSAATETIEAVQQERFGAATAPSSMPRVHELRSVGERHGISRD